MRSKKKATIGAFGATLAVALSFAGIAAPAHAAITVVPDAALAACINEGLDPTRDPAALISATELGAVDSIQCSGVADLTGLEHAIALTFLQLNDGTVSSLAPLAAVTTLRYLWVTARDGQGLTTSIDDLTPLDNSAQLVSLVLGNTATTALPNVAGMPELSELLLRGTQISNLAPLAGHPALSDLELSGSLVDDVSPLASIGKLSWLTITDAPLSDLRPLGTATSLSYLDLSRTQVSDTTGLDTLSGLLNLTLDGTLVRDVTPLRTLGGLQFLNLDGTLVRDVSPLGSLVTLAQLSLADTPLSDLSPLGRMAGLTALNLNGSLVSELAPLLGLSQLQFISFDDTAVSSVAGLATMPSLFGFMGNGAAVTDISAFDSSWSVALERQRVTHAPVVTAGDAVPNPLRGFEGTVLAPSAASLTAAGATLSADSRTITFAAPGTFALSWFEEPYGVRSEGAAIFSGTITFTVEAPFVPPENPPLPPEQPPLPPEEPPVGPPVPPVEPPVEPPVVTPVVTPPVPPAPAAAPVSPATPALAATGFSAPGWAIPAALLLLGAGTALTSIRLRRRA